MTRSCVYDKKMVLYAIFSCGTRSGRDKGINMARIPSIITSRLEEVRRLSTTRSVVNTGKAAKLWNRYDPDLIPTQNLGHQKCGSVEKLQADLEVAAKRDERAAEVVS